MVVGIHGILGSPHAEVAETVAETRAASVVLAVGLSYDTPRETLDIFVERLREILLDQPRIDREDLYVGLRGFGASSIDIELMFHLRVCSYGSQIEAQHAVVIDIIALADEVGVEFALPKRTVQVSSPANLIAPAADGAEAAAS